jgi:Adenylate and Guanylate cyclase catalytic domain
MRVGLNAGEVVVRAIGNDLHMDYSAVGETTVLAARMEQMATPGSIRLTAGTLGLVEGLVRVKALGPVPVKGLVEPVEVFTGVRQSPHWVAWLSEVCRLAGLGEEALQHARQALDLAQQQKDRGNEAHALYQLGVVQAHAGPPDAAQAEAHYQQALALAEERGMRPLMAHCHLGLGWLYGHTGPGEEARVALSAAIDLYHAMDMTFWLPQAEAALAQVEGQ